MAGVFLATTQNKNTVHTKLNISIPVQNFSIMTINMFCDYNSLAKYRGTKNYDHK